MEAKRDDRSGGLVNVVDGERHFNCTEKTFRRSGHSVSLNYSVNVIIPMQAWFSYPVRSLRGVKDT